MQYGSLLPMFNTKKGLTLFNIKANWTSFLIYFINLLRCVSITIINSYVDMFLESQQKFIIYTSHLHSAYLYFISVWLNSHSMVLKVLQLSKQSHLFRYSPSLMTPFPPLLEFLVSLHFVHLVPDVESSKHNDVSMCWLNSN